MSKTMREAIKKYAARHGTSVAQITLDYYRVLIESELNQEAEQV